LKIEENSLRGANTVVDSNPARVKAREEVQNFILRTSKMGAHVKNDVKQSVELVVSSDRLEGTQWSLVCLSVKVCVTLSAYRPSFGYTEKALIFV
jgi:hypothetical protein